MKPRRLPVFACVTTAVALALVASAVVAAELKGTVKKVDVEGKKLVIEQAQHKESTVRVLGDTTVSADTGATDLGSLKEGQRVTVTLADLAAKVAVEPEGPHRSILEEFWYNFRHNLFKPLLLFFYTGFLVPILRVKFEFPYVIYQGLTIYLLIAIGWKGGEELSELSLAAMGPVLGFMVLGFVTNFFIGILAYAILSATTKLRRVDKATVAGYYGSDSAGTFVTCLGVLASAHIAYGAYMPVMLAIMEIPGCLVALYLVSRLRHKGMDPLGTMPDEPGYDPKAAPPLSAGHGDDHGHRDSNAQESAVEVEEEMALEKMEHPSNGQPAKKPAGFLSPQLLHEVFLNPGLFLLFAGIFIGFLSGLQGHEVTKDDDSLFITLFQGVLCLFLLEMGMTASRKLKDLRTAGIGYVAFGLIAPNIFATIGMIIAHVYSLATGTQFELGTYVLFSVLCGAASYIAVPAVQRLAIPEASPTLPLAASLGLTFSYNVTIGIPVYIEIAKALLKYWH
ncbi:MAG: sodium-dependent bicarbonate transport family permease [Isosphaeraceae bacterium]|nr:sodium-dependent bicarbonate transport family permease [Isosphaeraceae bacterium]